jgi:hypothetical protein
MLFSIISEFTRNYLTHFWNYSQKCMTICLIHVIKSFSLLILNMFISSYLYVQTINIISRSSFQKSFKYSRCEFNKNQNSLISSWSNWCIKLLIHCRRLLILSHFFYTQMIHFTCLCLFFTWTISLMNFKTLTICTNFYEIIFYFELSELNCDYFLRRCIYLKTRWRR